MKEEIDLLKLLKIKIAHLVDKGKIELMRKSRHVLGFWYFRKKINLYNK